MRYEKPKHPAKFMWQTTSKINFELEFWVHFSSDGLFDYTVSPTFSF